MPEIIIDDETRRVLNEAIEGRRVEWITDERCRLAVRILLAVALNGRSQGAEVLREVMLPEFRRWAERLATREAARRRLEARDRELVEGRADRHVHPGVAGALGA